MAIKKYYVVVDNFGTTHWYKDAKCNILHRENGPAIERADGTTGWYQNGKIHRENGPAIDCADGHKEWWQNNLLHHTDGPAIEQSDGTMMWYQNGQLHRVDGPAIEWADGTTGWFISGKQLSKAAFLAATQPVVEMTVADVEKLVGKRVKIIK